MIEMIRRISRENPTWGAPRIHGEMMKLGYDLSEATVSRSMLKRRGRPTQNWKTFLRNHTSEIAAIDFLTMPTVMFRTLYVFVVLSLDRRRIVHLNVTYNPTATWTARQLYQAFPFDTAPKYLIRDRDGIYGREVRQASANMGIEEKVISALTSVSTRILPMGGRWSRLMLVLSAEWRWWVGCVAGITGTRLSLFCRIGRNWRGLAGLAPVNGEIHCQDFGDWRLGPLSSRDWDSLHVNLRGGISDPGVGAYGMGF